MKKRKGDRTRVVRFCLFPYFQSIRCASSVLVKVCQLTRNSTLLNYTCSMQLYFYHCLNLPRTKHLPVFLLKCSQQETGKIRCRQRGCIQVKISFFFIADWTEQRFFSFFQGALCVTTSEKLDRNSIYFVTARTSGFVRKPSPTVCILSILGSCIEICSSICNMKTIPPPPVSSTNFCIYFYSFSIFFFS